MKKLVTYTLAGLLCCSTMSGLAQATKETTQDKILRLEVENKSLQNQIKDLTQQVIELKAQQQAKTYSTPAPKKVAAPEKKKATLAPNKPAAPTTLKPYYANLDIQKKCEKLRKCREWAKKEYNRYMPYTKKGPVFKVVHADYQEQLSRDKTTLFQELSVKYEIRDPSLTMKGEKHFAEKKIVGKSHTQMRPPIIIPYPYPFRGR